MDSTETASAKSSLRGKKFQEYQDTGAVVKIYLINGICLSGKVLDFDNHSVLLSGDRERARSPEDAGEMLIEIQAIASAKPMSQKAV